MSYERPNEPPEHGPKPERIVPESVHVARDGTVTLNLQRGGHVTIELRGAPHAEGHGPTEARHTAALLQTGPENALSPPTSPHSGQAHEVIVTYSGWSPTAEVHIRLDNGWPPGITTTE